MATHREVAAAAAATLCMHEYMSGVYTSCSRVYQAVGVLGCETTHGAKQKRGAKTRHTKSREHSGNRTVDLTCSMSESYSFNHSGYYTD